MENKIEKFRDSKILKIIIGWITMTTFSGIGTYAFLFGTHNLWATTHGITNIIVSAPGLLVGSFFGIGCVVVLVACILVPIFSIGKLFDK